MLRPIDTQTIYQQSQEISNRQQAHKQGEEMQQVQFAHLVQKETKEKREGINEVQQDEKINNEPHKEKKKQHNKQEKREKNKSGKEKKIEKKAEKKVPATHFDARV